MAFLLILALFSFCAHHCWYIICRHPDVADVLDGHPELVDIMTELLGERESLQQALQQTQEEMNR